MIELSAEERLTALRLLRRVQVDDLARTDRWIAQAEQQAADQQKPKPPPEPTRAPLPRPPYITQRRHGDLPPVLHGPECWVRDDGIGSTPLTEETAREQLETFVVEACDACHPEKALGMP